MSATAKKRQMKPHQAQISQEVDYLKVLVGRPPISFYQPFGRLAGSAGAGLFLSQLIYWSSRGTDPDGWIYKTQAEWIEETCLKRGEQESARRKLIDLGILIEDKRGIPYQLFFKIDFQVLHQKIMNLCQPAGDAAEGLPKTAAGWKKLLPDLVEAGIWDYKTYTNKKINNLKTFSLSLHDRIDKMIDDTGKPADMDVEALKAHREHRARVQARQAADETANAKKEDKPRLDPEKAEPKFKELHKLITKY